MPKSQILKTSFFVFLLFAYKVCSSQSYEVCFSIDDLPVVAYSNKTPGFEREVTEKLMSSCRKYGIPAIGFVNAMKLYDDEGKEDTAKVALLKMWMENDLQLGNHSFSHKSYNKSSFEEYTTDILEGEKICKNLVEKYSKTYNYYRHPFLQTGNTKGKSDSLSFFLKTHGYKEAPVTIDNSDYLFALAYHRAMTNGDTILMDSIGVEYIRYMERKIKYYQSISLKLFGRNIKHILLIHANALNADYLDDLAEMYKSNHYKFISIDDALTDEAYQTEITRFGNWGISWLDRWALSSGKKGDFFKEDPATPQFIKTLTE